MHRSDGEILFVTDRLFWRRSMGSEQRIAALVRFLCRRGFRITVAYVGRIDRRESGNLKPFVAECPGLSIITRPHPATTPFASACRGFRRVRERLATWRRTPGPTTTMTTTTIAGRRASPARRAFVERTIAERTPRIVVIEFLRLTGLVDPRPAARPSAADSPRTRAPLYLVDTIDLLHERAESFRAEGLEPDHEIDAATEARALARFDAVIAIQHREAERLRRLVPSRPVLEVPHGISMPIVPRVSHPAADERPLRIGFLGGRNESNARALDWFVDWVWPRLTGELGTSIELHVAGQICATWHRPASESIRSWGPIDSIDCFWPEIDVAINPVRVGSGLKIKNVEALAYGRPLLTTSVGAQGLEEASPSGLHFDDTPEGWIAVLVAWAIDADRRFAIARHGYEFATAHFSEEAAFEPLLRYLEEAIR